MIPHKCANPTCANIIEDDKHKFCSPECHKQFRDGLKHIEDERPNINFTVDSDIEEDLDYIGINKSTYGKPFAYRNWVIICKFIKDNSGVMAFDKIKARLRTKMGMQYRYIDEYFDGLFAWDIIFLNNDNLYYRGKPKDEDKD